MEASRIHEGMTVYARGGEKLGKVIACQPDHFIIEKGFFFPKDYLARYDEVRDVRGDDEVVLDLAASEIGTTAGGAAAQAAGRTETERSTAAPLGAGTHEETRIPLAEEQIEAQKRMREAGEVRVTKEVKTEHRQIDVPVTKEEVHVERVPASGQPAGEASFKEGTVSVPIREEEVEIKKRPVVKEEVRVSKTARQGELRADADVRKETARVEEKGDVRREGDAGLPHAREPEE